MEIQLFFASNKLNYFCVPEIQLFLCFRNSIIFFQRNSIILFVTEIKQKLNCFYVTEIRLFLVTEILLFLCQRNSIIFASQILNYFVTEI